MDEMLDKVREAIYKAVEGATMAAKGAIDKTNNVASRTKVSFTISETESKIKDVYRDLGKAVYEKYKAEGAEDEDILERCTQIDKLFEEVKLLKEKLAILRCTKICPQCGEHNRMENDYCSKCGTKLENAVVEEPEDDEENFADKAEDFVENIREKAEEAIQSDRAEEIIDAVKEKTEDVIEDIKEKADDIIDEEAVESFTSKVKEKVSDIKDAAAKKVVTIKARKPSDK